MSEQSNPAVSGAGTDAGASALGRFDAGKGATELLEAMRAERPIDDLSEAARPRNFAEARAIQDALVQQLGGHGGWKVGQYNPDGETGCAPLARCGVLPSGALWQLPIVQPIELEGEIAVTFARDLAGPGTFTTEDVRGAMAALHPALEVASSRFVDKQRLPMLTTLADLQSNAGLILGPAQWKWQDLDLASLRMELRFDGELVAQVGEGPDQGRMLAALTWLANHARDRGMPLRKGDAVLTGARIKPVKVQRGVAVELKVDGLASVTYTS